MGRSQKKRFERWERCFPSIWIDGEKNPLRSRGRGPVHGHLPHGPRPAPVRSGPELNEIFVGVLAQAQRLYGVSISSVVCLSNHYHLTVRVDSALRLARFMGYLNSNLGREIGCLRQWPDKVFARRYQATLISDEEAAQVERLKYVLSHGCKEDLVERPGDWPGVHCVEALTGGKPRPGIGSTAPRSSLRDQVPPHSLPRPGATSFAVPPWHAARWSSWPSKMRQNLTDPLARSARHLQDIDPELPSILIKDLAELLIDAPSETGVLWFRNRHSIWIFDWHKDDQIESFHCVPHTWQPVLHVKPLGFAMNEQVGKEVHRASVEDAVSLAVGDAFDRAVELQLEILAAWHRRERVPLLLEKVIRLIDHFVRRKSTRQLLHQRRLA
jgi:hypothetical protein